MVNPVIITVGVPSRSATPSCSCENKSSAQALAAPPDLSRTPRLNQDHDHSGSRRRKWIVLLNQLPIATRCYAMQSVSRVSLPLKLITSSSFKLLHCTHGCP